MTSELELARRIGTKYVRPLAEDAFAIANLGLVKAAQSFDPALGGFGPYARLRIEGELKDALRNRSPLNRAEAEAGVEPPTFASIDLAISEGGFDPVDGDPLPEAQAEANDVKERVLLAMHSLAKRDATILRASYIDDLPLAAIGRQLGIGESRVAQLRARALVRLREALGVGQ